MAVTPEEQLQEILDHCKDLNARISECVDQITITEARRMSKMCRYAEGWLAGIRTILLRVHG